MEFHHRKSLVAVLIALSAAGAGVLACSLPSVLGGEEPESRIATLEAELQSARSEATAQADTAPDEGPAETIAVQEDFETESSAFQLGEGASIEDGALVLGPYEECANDVANFDQPIGCMVVCQDCGRNMAEFRLRVDFTFADGLADREFGMILRLVDEDLDGLLDREDYLLALGFNIYENKWQIYLHEPDRLEPWRVVSSGSAGFLLPGRMNELVVDATEGGRLMQITLNEKPLDWLAGGEREPGQRLVDPWRASGAVGFLGLGRGVQARFDDFELNSLP